MAMDPVQKGNIARAYGASQYAPVYKPSSESTTSNPFLSAAKKEEKFTVDGSGSLFSGLYVPESKGTGVLGEQYQPSRGRIDYMC